MNVTTSGFDTLPFKSWSFQQVFNEWAGRAGPVVKEAARNAAPVRTGKARDSITYEIGGEAEGGTGTDNMVRIMSYGVPYMGYIISGTQPHMIYGNPLLSFQWNGKQMIVHSVHHPGTKANNFPERAYNQVRDTIVEQMLDVINESLGGAA